MNKSKKSIIVLISVLTALALFLVGVMSFVIAGGDKIFKSVDKSYKNRHYTSGNVIFDKSYALTDFDSLSIDTSWADITFEQNDNANEVRVVAYAKKDNVIKGNISDRELKIDETRGRITLDKKSIFKGLHFESIRLVVFLPQNFNCPIDVDSDVGDIKFNTPYASKLDVDLSTGDINAYNLGGKFDINTDTGDVEIKYAHPTSDSSVETDTGDITIGSIKNTNIEYETDMGDTYVNSNDENSDVTLSLSTDTGDISVND